MKTFSLKIISVCAAIVFLLVACDRSYDYYTTSYIQRYTLMDDIKVKMSGKYKISLSPIGDKSVSFRSTGEDKALYDAICAENGDTSFNRDVTLIVDLINVSSSYPDVSSINVTSDKDFDAQHPAGTPLNDCLEVTFYCAYQYIQSGYNEDELDREKQTKLLSEVKSTEFLLNTNRREFKFVKQPTALGTHTLTFSLTSVTGEVLEDTIQYVFTGENL